jgi:signal peptidase I
MAKAERAPRGPLKPLRLQLRKLKSKNAFLAFIVDTVVILLSALLISFLIKSFLLRSFYIPSGSMFETLQINDRIVVNELVPNVVPLQRGDVVVFKDPGGWLSFKPTKKPTTPVGQMSEWLLSVTGLSAPDNDQHLVKRVIGVGGDHVVCCDAKKRITINGKSITEPYVAKGSDASRTDFDVTVPKGSFWVMGDNRGNSQDSRYHPDAPGKGFVASKYVVGRAFIISWPFSHFKWLDNYADVFKNVSAPKP